jgi:hypothetical protein
MLNDSTSSTEIHLPAHQGSLLLSCASCPPSRSETAESVDQQGGKSESSGYVQVFWTMPPRLIPMPSIRFRIGASFRYSAANVHPRSKPKPSSILQPTHPPSPGCHTLVPSSRSLAWVPSLQHRHRYVVRRMYLCRDGNASATVPRRLGD